MRIAIFHYDYHGRRSESNWSVSIIEGESINSYTSAFYIKDNLGDDLFTTAQAKENYKMLRIKEV